MSKLRGLLGLAALVAVVGGCGCGAAEDGDGGAEPTRATVDRALADLRAAFETGDASRVCGLTAAPARCAPLARRLLRARDRASTDAAGSGDRSAIAVRRRGREAVATVTFDDRLPGELRFVERGGRWKLVDLALAPVPAKSTWPLVRAASELHHVERRRGGRSVACPPIVRVLRSGDDSVRGGCALRFASDDVAVLQLTAVGDFVVARCRSGFTVSTSSNITGPLADQIDFGGPGPCGEIERCPDKETGLRYPWQGSKLEGPFEPALDLNFDICVNTPFGRARGLFYLRLARRGGRWTATAYDYPLSHSSVRLDGTWRVTPPAFEVLPGL